MKQETKQTIDWIKKQINLAKENCINPCHKDGYPEYEADYEKAMKFLDSLPDEEFDRLIVHKDGTVEVELRTITENELRYNDLRIYYLQSSNIIVIDYNNYPSSFFYNYKVIEKGKPVKFKAKSEFGNLNKLPGLRIFDTENMELL